MYNIDEQKYKRWVSQFSQRELEMLGDPVKVEEIYHNEPGLAQFLTWSNESYGGVPRDDNEFNTLLDQYEYNEKRKKTGLPGLKFADSFYSPNKYSDRENEVNSYFVSVNKRLPESHEFNYADREYEQYLNNTKNKLLGLKKGQAVDYSTLNKWSEYGIGYNDNDSDDMLRKVHNLPPAAWLEAYEDKDRLANGQLPLKMENTNNALKELQSFYGDVNQLIMQGKADAESITNAYSQYQTLAGVDMYTMENSLEEIELSPLDRLYGKEIKKKDAPFYTEALMEEGYQSDMLNIVIEDALLKQNELYPSNVKGQKGAKKAGTFIKALGYSLAQGNYQWLGSNTRTAADIVNRHEIDYSPDSNRAGIQKLYDPEERQALMDAVKEAAEEFLKDKSDVSWLERGRKTRRAQEIVSGEIAPDEFYYNDKSDKELTDEERTRNLINMADYFGVSTQDYTSPYAELDNISQNVDSYEAKIFRLIEENPNHAVYSQIKQLLDKGIPLQNIEAVDIPSMGMALDQYKYEEADTSNDTPVDKLRRFTELLGSLRIVDKSVYGAAASAEYFDNSQYWASKAYTGTKWDNFSGAVANMVPIAYNSALATLTSYALGPNAGKAVMMSSFGSYSYGSYAEEARQLGANYKDQKKFGMYGALVEGATEALVISSFLKNVGNVGLKTIYQSLGKNGLKNTMQTLGIPLAKKFLVMLEEPVQEMSADVLSNVYKNMTFQKGEVDIIDAEQLRQSGTQAFYMGTIMWVLGLPFGSAARTYAESEIKAGRKPNADIVYEKAQVDKANNTEGAEEIVDAIEEAQAPSVDASNAVDIEASLEDVETTESDANDSQASGEVVEGLAQEETKEINPSYALQSMYSNELIVSDVQASMDATLSNAYEMAELENPLRDVIDQFDSEDINLAEQIDSLIASENEELQELGLSALDMGIESLSENHPGRKATSASELFTMINQEEDVISNDSILQEQQHSEIDGEESIADVPGDTTGHIAQEETRPSALEDNSGERNDQKSEVGEGHQEVEASSRLNSEESPGKTTRTAIAKEAGAKLSASQRITKRAIAKDNITAKVVVDETTLEPYQIRAMKNLIAVGYPTAYFVPTGDNAPAALTVRVKGRPAISINTATKESDLPFYIAHEEGHIIIDRANTAKESAKFLKYLSYVIDDIQMAEIINGYFESHDISESARLKLRSNKSVLTEIIADEYALNITSNTRMKSLLPHSLSRYIYDTLSAIDNGSKPMSYEEHQRANGFRHLVIEDPNTGELFYQNTKDPKDANGWRGFESGNSDRSNLKTVSKLFEGVNQDMRDVVSNHDNDTKVFYHMKGEEGLREWGDMDSPALSGLRRKADYIRVINPYGTYMLARGEATIAQQLDDKVVHESGNHAIHNYAQSSKLELDEVKTAQFRNDELDDLKKQRDETNIKLNELRKDKNSSLTNIAKAERDLSVIRGKANLINIKQQKATRDDSVVEYSDSAKPIDSVKEEGLTDKYYSHPHIPGYSKFKDNWFGDREQGRFTAQIIANGIERDARRITGEKRVGNKTKLLLRAIQLHIDISPTKDNPNRPNELIEKYYDKLSKEQKAILNKAMHLTSQELALETKIRKIDHTWGVKALDAGVLRNLIDNHITRQWHGVNKAEENVRLGVANNRIATETGLSKGRVYDSILQGWAEGNTLATDGAHSSLQHSITELSRSIADREFVTALRGFKDSKGRTTLSTVRYDGYEIVLDGRLKVWEWAEDIPLDIGGTVFEDVNHKNVSVNEKVVFKDDAKKRKYTVYGKEMHEEKEYIIIKRSPRANKLLIPASELKKVSFGSRDVYINDFGEVYVKRQLYAPKEVAKQLNTIVGKSKFTECPFLMNAVRIQSSFKRILLSSALFHHLALSRSAIAAAKWSDWNVPRMYREGKGAIVSQNHTVELGVQQGLTLDFAAEWDTTKNYSTNGKIPGALKQMFNRQSHFLFNRMLPSLKAKAFLMKMKELDRTDPEMSKQEKATIAASFVNDDFGGINLDRMGRNKTVQDILTLGLLAPDWTESNLRMTTKAFTSKTKFGAGSVEARKFYQRTWAHIIGKYMSATVMFNLLLSLMDDDDFFERYQKAWNAGRTDGQGWRYLRWTQLDVTPVYKILGGKKDERKYFSLIGHLLDPLKWGLRPFDSIKHKGGIFTKIVTDAFTGTDWAGRPFTTMGELLGIDNKGVYTQDYKDHKKGDPKGGQLTGKLIKTGDYFQSGSGIKANQIPSFLLYEAKGILPIPIQAAISWVSGEHDAWDMFMQTSGLNGMRTKEVSNQKRFDETRLALKQKVVSGSSSQNENMLYIRMEKLKKEISRYSSMYYKLVRENANEKDIERIENALSELYQQGADLANSIN